jgi:hypothetical protein
MLEGRETGKDEQIEGRGVRKLASPKCHDFDADTVGSREDIEHAAQLCDVGVQFDDAIQVGATRRRWTQYQPRSPHLSRQSASGQATAMRASNSALAIRSCTKYRAKADVINSDCQACAGTAGQAAHDQKAVSRCAAVIFCLPAASACHRGTPLPQPPRPLTVPAACHRRAESSCRTDCSWEVDDGNVIRTHCSRLIVHSLTAHAPRRSWKARWCS